MQRYLFSNFVTLPRVVCTMAFGAACLSVPAAPATSAPSAAKASSGAIRPAGGDLLRAMMKAERTISFSGVETTTRRGEPGATRARVWRQGLKRRLEFVAPSVRRGDLLIDDGLNVWLYHSGEKTAVQTKSARRAADSLGLSKIQRAFDVRMAGTARVAGRSALIVELTPRGRKRVGHRFWIDQATGVRLRADRIAPGGQVLESVALQSVRFGPVPATRFAWTPPPGTQVTRTSGALFTQLAPARRAAPWLQYPRATPDGYALESAIVDNKKGEAWLRYTNGVRRFSIFQQRARDTQSAGGTTPLRQVQGGWYWQRGGSRMLGVGIPSALADKVVKTIR